MARATTESTSRFVATQSAAPRLIQTSPKRSRRLTPPNGKAIGAEGFVAGVDRSQYSVYFPQRLIS
jgi:hypothetical protein